MCGGGGREREGTRFKIKEMLPNLTHQLRYVWAWTALISVRLFPISRWSASGHGDHYNQQINYNQYNQHN